MAHFPNQNVVIRRHDMIRQQLQADALGQGVYFFEVADGGTWVAIS
jgi:hypothetical protein